MATVGGPYTCIDRMNTVVCCTYKQQWATTTFKCSLFLRGGSMVVHRSSEYDSLEDVLDDYSEHEVKVYIDTDHVVVEELGSGDQVFFARGAGEVRDAAVLLGQRLGYGVVRQ